MDACTTYISDVEHGAQFTAGTRLGWTWICAEAVVPDEDPGHSLWRLGAFARDRHRRSNECQREGSSDGGKTSVHGEVCWDMGVTAWRKPVIIYLFVL